MSRSLVILANYAARKIFLGTSCCQFISFRVFRHLEVGTGKVWAPRNSHPQAQCPFECGSAHRLSTRSVFALDMSKWVFFQDLLAALHTKTQSVGLSGLVSDGNLWASNQVWDALY